MLSKHCLYTESNSKLSVLHLSCWAIYNKLLEKTIAKPTSVQYWEDKIVDSGHKEIEWSTVYLIPRFATTDSYTRAFQFKIINNALFLNKKLSAVGITELPECSLCKQEAETAIHLFCQCPVTSELWEKLQGCLSPNLKAHCYPRISYGHTKFISQVPSKNVGTSVDVSFHITGF